MSVVQCFDETISRLRSHCAQGLLRFAHALDDLAATARRCPSPGERQYPVLALGDDGLAQKDFDSRRANRRALDRVPHILLGARAFEKVERPQEERPRRGRRQGKSRLARPIEEPGQLGGGIAHDFNNLLMIIIGNLERAGRDAQALGASAANLPRSIANAMRGAQRAAALTHRLLAFARRQPLNPKVLDLNKYLPGVAEFLQCSLGETIELEVTGAARLWPFEVDVPQLETSLVSRIRPIWSAMRRPSTAMAAITTSPTRRAIPRSIRFTTRRSRPTFSWL